MGIGRTGGENIREVQLLLYENSRFAGLNNEFTSYPRLWFLGWTTGTISMPA